MPSTTAQPVVPQTLPQPPTAYSQLYMQQLVAALIGIIRAQNEVHYVRASGLFMPAVPTSTTGLKSGEVYSDSGTLKIVP